MPSVAVARPALVMGALLLVPLVAMLLTDEVDWTVGDFILAGALVFGALMAFEYLAPERDTAVGRALVGVAIAVALAIVWTLVAVGG